MNDLANRILSSGGDYLNGIFCGFYFTLRRVFDLRSKTIGATDWHTFAQGEDGEPRIGLDLFGHNAVVCCFFFLLQILFVRSFVIRPLRSAD